MVRHLDSGYSQPHMNEHESQQGPMLKKGMAGAKAAIAQHEASEEEKARVQAAQAANQLDKDGNIVPNLLDEEGKPLPVAAMNTSAPVSAANPLVEGEAPEPTPAPEAPTEENPLVEDEGIDDIA